MADAGIALVLAAVIGQGVVVLLAPQRSKARLMFACDLVALAGAVAAIGALIT